MRKLIPAVALVLLLPFFGATPAWAAVPAIDSFAPTSGPVGTSVVITGTGFIGNEIVEFNGWNAAFTVDSDTQITAIVPPPATSGPIAVANPDGTDLSMTHFTVIDTPTSTPPDITGFDPGRGPIGARVTIVGTNLEDVIDVRLRGRSVQFNSQYSEQIRFRVPQGAESGRIEVESPDGSDTSDTIFRIGRYKHRSYLDFKLERHLVAVGIVHMYDGPFVCVNQRRVTVQRLKGGSWRAVGKDRTGPTGRYRMTLPDATGTYRAVVRKKTTAADICSRDSARLRDHQH